MKENTMTEKEINKLGEEYGLNPTKFEENQNQTQNDNKTLSYSSLYQ